MSLKNKIQKLEGEMFAIDNDADDDDDDDDANLWLAHVCVCCFNNIK